MEPKFKRYRYQDGRLYDVILYDGYNKDDIVNFLDERFIKHTCTESYIDQSNGDRKTYIDIKIDINDDIINVYLFPYRYLLYDIGKKYIDTCESETLYKNFKEVSDIDDDKDTIIESSKDDKTNSYITILGTDYSLCRVSSDHRNGFDKVLGVCDRNLKVIYVIDTNTIESYKNKDADWRFREEQHSLHHEIVHAYFTECGLNSCVKNTVVPWSEDEEIVDWIAFMNRKISASFDEADKWLSDLFKQESDKNLKSTSPDNK